MDPVIHWTLLVRYLHNRVSCTNFAIICDDDSRGRRALLRAML
jgi:hypothetical protein